MKADEFSVMAPLEENKGLGHQSPAVVAVAKLEPPLDGRDRIPG